MAAMERFFLSADIARVDWFLDSSLAPTRLQCKFYTTVPGCSRNRTYGKRISGALDTSMSAAGERRPHSTQGVCILC
jgi:hypothetical protein